MGTNADKTNGSFDPVEEASEESFPASDSPAWAMGEENHPSVEAVLNVDAVLNNEAENRFELHVGGKTAFLDYQRRGEEIVLSHAEVPVDMQGAGLGSKVVRAGLEFARLQHLQVVPLCSFVVRYIREHPEYVDLVRTDYRSRFTKGT